MQFEHDFAADLEALDFFSPDPWALVRFADGERAVIEGKGIRTADGWKSEEPCLNFHQALTDSMIMKLDGYHVGIPCPCCDTDSRAWYIDRMSFYWAGVSDRRDVTFSNIFANANYDRFRERALAEHFGHRCVIVGSGAACHYDIPSNLVNHPEAMAIIDDLVKRLYDETKTILVAAGPASNVIIHRYWTSCPPEKRRVICDIGSALDPWLHGRFTRGYHDPKHPNRKKVCVWAVD